MRTFVVIGLLLGLGVMSPGRAATFGTVVAIDGGVSDLVLDETRGRLYAVNSPQNRVEIYDIAGKQLLSPVSTTGMPLSAALSADGQSLYVTNYGGSTLDVIDLNSLVTTSHVTLPGAPEGVAVGGDGRVLITTAGTTTSTNNLLLYDPSTGTVSPVSIAPPAPTSAGLAPSSGRVYMTSRSHLESSRDGRYIIGMNNPTTTTRQVFVYEVASGGVLRSRSVTSISSVLSVAADGSKFMAGLTLFDSASLSVIAQQNAANSIYLFPANVNFNTQANQGGSVFAPDGSAIYSAFNIAPVQTPAAAADVSQFMINDPDNLLINLALQTPENLAGKVVITSDGKTAYAISQSGFLMLPLSDVYNRPIAATSTSVVLLTHDQCGVTAATQTGTVNIQNQGKGPLTVSATLQSSTATSTTPALGGGRAGAGGFTFPGLPIFVIGAPGAGGGGFAGGAGGAGGAGAGGGGFAGGAGGAGRAGGAAGAGAAAGAAGANTPINTTTTSSTAPSLSVIQTDSGPAFQFAYNPANAASLGTVTPHDFAVQATQAINIPPTVRVYQNNRNAEATGNIIPVPVGTSTAEGLMDIVSDKTRNLLYIANAGLNRVEVFDTQAMQFRSPIKVGQLPQSLALSPDGGTLYVANSGGENISVIDPNQLQVTGMMSMPPIPFNASFAISTSQVIVSTQSGLQAVMSDGTNNTLWKSVGNHLMPRGVSPVMGTTTSGTPATITAPYNMAATPDGSRAILLDGSGNAYLYDASSDQFTIKQQIFSAPLQSYYGAVSAGPGGQYYLANGAVLNASLTPTSTSSVTSGTTTTVRPISAVAAINGTMFARFVQPTRTSTTAAVTAAPTVEMVNATSGTAMGAASALEGPLSTQGGTTRVNVPGRMMAVDAGATNAFLLTTSGLTIVPLPSLPQGGGGPGGFGGGGGQVPSFLSNTPLINQNGIVNTGDYQSTVTPDSIVSIYGTNLASSASATVSSATPLPDVLGGVCVTLNNQPLPLLLTSAGQINLQIPPALAAGKYPLVVRSIQNQAASFSQTVTVSKYAPAVNVDPSTEQASIYHSDGSLVTTNNPATRDQNLIIYATGLGPTTGGTVTAGLPSPSNPMAVTGKVSVYFGAKTDSRSPVIVTWSGLSPNMIGVYQINVTVPGTHISGNQVPVTISVGGVDSPSTGANLPYVAVH